MRIPARLFLLAVAVSACADAPRVAAPRYSDHRKRSTPSLTDKLIGPIGDAILQSTPAQERGGLSIGVLAQGATESSASVAIASTATGVRYFRFVRDRSGWRRERELEPREVGIAAVPGTLSSVYDGSRIGYFYPPSGGPQDFYNPQHVHEGSFIGGYSSSSGYASGLFLGNYVWAADSLFVYHFTQWRYNATNLGGNCLFAMKDGADNPQSFVSSNENAPQPPQGQPSSCPANSVLVYFDLEKTYVRSPTQTSGGNSGSGGPTPTATMYGPTDVKPSASCYWYVGYSSVDNPIFEWRVDGNPVGTDQDLWYESGSSQFELTVAVYNWDGSWAATTRTVNVSSSNGDCYVQ